MFARRIVYTLCGVVLLGVLATSAGAMDTRRTTYFTFSGAVQMPGVVLPAGTYIFEVVNPNSSSDVVSVVSRDRKKVYLMQLTRFVERARTGDLKATIALGETSAGNPPPVKAWYPQFETRGREFIY
ncbi:MAG: hypothetical protein ABIS29_07100 [Vicinamibacterales bacterium]